MESTPSNRGRIVTLGLMSVIFLAAGGSCYNSDLFRASRQLEEQRAKAKAEGLIVDIQEYKPVVALDAVNAAPAYRKAIEDVEGSCKDAFQTIHKYRKGTPTPSEETELNKALDQASPTLDLVAEASKLPAMDFGRDWSKGFSLAFPEYGPLRLLGDGLRLDAKRKLGRGDVSGAIERARAIARMGHHIGEEPTIIASLVQAGSVDQSFDVLSEAILYHGRDPKVRAGVREAVQEMGPSPDIRHATLLEMAWQVQAIDSLRDGSDWIKSTSGSATPFSAKLGKIGVVRKAYQARSIEYWRGFNAALPKDPTDYMGAFKGIREHDEQYDTAHAHKGHRHGSRDGLSYSMLQLLRPVFSGASTVMAREEAKKRLLIAAVNVLDGNPKLPIDPFSGAPLVHKGNLIYSFAENQKDDGGSVKRAQGRSLPLDFVIRLPK